MASFKIIHVRRQKGLFRSLVVTRRGSWPVIVEINFSQGQNKLFCCCVHCCRRVGICFVWNAFLLLNSLTMSSSSVRSCKQEEKHTTMQNGQAKPFYQLLSLTRYTHEQRRTTREKTAETTAIFKAKIRGRDLVSCDLGSEEEPSSPKTKNSSLHWKCLFSARRSRH